MVKSNVITKRVMCARTFLDLNIGDEGLFNCNGSVVCGIVQEVITKSLRKDVNIYRISNINVAFHYGLEMTEDELIEIDKKSKKSQ